MSEVILQHYSGFSGESRSSWIHRPSYRNFWARFLIEFLEIKRAHRIVDLGGGWGDLSKALVKFLNPSHHVICVDPSPALLRRIGNGSVTPIQADALEYLRTCGDSTHDRIILKQVIHHIPERKRPLLYRELHRVLSPGGKASIMTMPETILYPMFKAAVRNFERGQIKHRTIASGLGKAGFTVTETPGDYPVRISWSRYCGAVRERFISDLRPFSSEEIEAGLSEVQNHLRSSREMRFYDRLVAFTGTKV